MFQENKARQIFRLDLLPYYRLYVSKTPSPGADILLVIFSTTCDVDAATFDVIMTIYSQDITKKPTHKYTFLRNMYMQEKNSYSFSGEHFTSLYVINHLISLAKNEWQPDNFVNKYPGPSYQPLR